MKYNHWIITCGMLTSQNATLYCRLVIKTPCLKTEILCFNITKIKIVTRRNTCTNKIMAKMEMTRDNLISDWKLI